MSILTLCSLYRIFNYISWHRHILCKLVIITFKNYYILFSHWRAHFVWYLYVIFLCLMNYHFYFPTTMSSSQICFPTTTPTINQTNITNLIKMPDALEIKTACFHFHPLKTPSEDGFHALFYQKNWEIVSPQIIKSIQHIFTSWSTPASWGNTLLCLNPKINNPSRPSHLRHIGLCTTHYKILGKLLTNRLKPILHDLISPVQGAFQKGKHTNDLFITTHEILHSMHNSKCKHGWLVLKLDIRKAFDTILWDFILSMLRNFNFPPQWLTLLSSIFDSFLYAPIINSKKLSTFKPNHGIRQGDPISPYLFILAMEFLNLSIINEVNSKNWTPFSFKNSNSTLNISHLFFADDILIFAKPIIKVFNPFKIVLKTFLKLQTFLLT